MGIDEVERGKETELRFKDWLEKHSIPYLYIKQDSQTFSAVFRDYKLKRPDFMILLENFGFIFVDVKNKKLSSNPNYPKTYPIDKIETKKFSSLQRKFNLQIWYVLSNEDSDYKTWLWIPVSKVLESGIGTKISGKSQQPFFPVPPEEFIQIADNDSINGLFYKSF